MTFTQLTLDQYSIDTQLTVSQNIGHVSVDTWPIQGQYLANISTEYQSIESTNTTCSKHDLIEQQSESVNNLPTVDHVSTSMSTKRQLILNHISAGWSFAICEMG